MIEVLAKVFHDIVTGLTDRGLNFFYGAAQTAWQKWSDDKGNFIVCGTMEATPCVVLSVQSFELPQAEGMPATFNVTMVYANIFSKQGIGRMQESDTGLELIKEILKIAETSGYALDSDILYTPMMNGETKDTHGNSIVYVGGIAAFSLKGGYC